MTLPLCPYCDRPTKLALGAHLYPKKPDLRQVIYVACVPCGAWVRARPGSGDPMGCIANKELRTWKAKLGTALDSISKGACAKMDPSSARHWMATGMKVSVDDIPWFDIMQCQIAIAYIENNKDKIPNGPVKKQNPGRWQRSPYKSRF